MMPTLGNSVAPVPPPAYHRAQAQLCILMPSVLWLGGSDSLRAITICSIERLTENVEVRLFPLPRRHSYNP